MPSSTGAPLSIRYCASSTCPHESDGHEPKFDTGAAQDGSEATHVATPLARSSAPRSSSSFTMDVRPRDAARYRTGTPPTLGDHVGRVTRQRPIED